MVALCHIVQSGGWEVNHPGAPEIILHKESSYTTVRIEKLLVEVMASAYQVH